jgi:hypothetical protein
MVGSFKGQRRLEVANPSVRALERAIERDLSSDEVATVEAWLVATAQRLERATESRARVRLLVRKAPLGRDAVGL